MNPGRLLVASLALLAGCAGERQAAAPLPPPPVVPGSLQGHWVAADPADQGGFIEVGATMVVVHLAGLPRLAAPPDTVAAAASGGRLTFADGHRVFLSRTVEPVCRDRPQLGMAEVLHLTVYRQVDDGGERNVGQARALSPQAVAMAAMAAQLAPAAAPAPSPAPSPDQRFAGRVDELGDDALVRAGAELRRLRSAGAPADQLDRAFAQAVQQRRLALLDLLDGARTQGGGLERFDRDLARLDGFRAAVQDWRHAQP
ncbi:MAG: hypothetical protein L6R48_21305 [Planctomycetes bacterium]|nr:hypothetical protein [Planctomycetota bacterium]